ncbi:MAG: dehypoxanthine futalosine cyclase [Bacteroidales bacterium]|jgi:cyclic dehypoxanthinyl futalosine synthase|nr:dehypoxanthine futalosine cyclase [Bacteroidales bacterium]
MKLDTLYKKAENLEFLNLNEGLTLYNNAPLSELIFLANNLRKKHVPGKIVTWQIDRNVNITNSCISQCKFCNFYRSPKSSETFVTSLSEYKNKIEELISLGGDQLLLQGGLHPKLGLEFYTDLFSSLKKMSPTVKLHALGPPEIAHIASIEGLTYSQVLKELVKSGLDSLPGAGAEILSERVRKIISPAKATAKQWLDVMREAHKLNISTSATMMYGHVETLEERIQHLIYIREIQAMKPEYSDGFVAFIPWPFMDEGTVLRQKNNIINNSTAEDYIRLIAISRIMLPNIKNIQASWLTIGKDIAQICLHAGANDFGSIMIEENVVSAAGADYRFDAKGMKNAIIEAGYIPQLRNQRYEYR